MNSILSVIFGMFGLVAAGLFHVDVYFPIWLSVAIMVYVSLYLLHLYRIKFLGILILLIWLVYALPFIHLVPYLWFDFTQTDPLVLWGLATNDYMLDESVIELTGMLGAVGAVGMALGVSLNTKPIQVDMGTTPDGNKRIFQTMNFPIWSGWVSVGIVLSWLVAPEHTIFTAEYTMSSAKIDTAKFGSAWMMSYVILAFAFCDALLEQKATIKLPIILGALIVVVVIFQLLRGDRESVPLVFGLALLYFYWASGITQASGFSIPWLKICAIAFGLIVASMFLGALRHTLVGASVLEVGGFVREMNEAGTLGLDTLLNGTWSATLLTPLSVAGDHIYGLLELKLGQDYLNFLLSTPPGFVADTLGYIRPLDQERGPAWEMRYGQGGTHAVVVPFMNFRMLGVFLIPAIWAFVIASYEKAALKEANAANFCLLVTIATISPHWLWYGEKAIFNAIVLWIVFSFLYKISIGSPRYRKVHYKPSSG